MVAAAATRTFIPVRDLMEEVGDMMILTGTNARVETVAIIGE